MKRLGRQFVRLNVIQPTPLENIGGEMIGYAAIATRWVDTKEGPFRDLRVNACVALAGDVGHSVRCTVYERRPEVCRMAIQPGDEWCRQLRTRFAEQVKEIRDADASKSG